MQDNPSSPPEEPYAERTPAVRLWYELRLAARFLTRLPVLALEFTGHTSLAAASWAFPVVGLGVGIIGAIALGLAHWLGIPADVSAALALAAMVVVTGALHEDGLADTADGFGLIGDAERRLAAMRDVRTGAFGITALLIVFALRWSALGGLGADGAVALIGAATISRGVLPYVMHAVPNARSDGLSAGAGRPEFRPALWALIIAAIVALFAFGFGGAIVVLVVAGLIATGLAVLARRLIGGQTGDVLGAIQQIVEAGVLITSAALLP
jgi:adenosylcobinamide-GDP ribazoletransferase